MDSKPEKTTAVPVAPAPTAECKLGSWKNDMAGGFMSITSYFQFGNPSNQTGMPNNLALYLESDKPKYI